MGIFGKKIEFRSLSFCYLWILGLLTRFKSGFCLMKHALKDKKLERVFAS